MINFIEKMLQELQANGLGYPKILLLRKKEIQRRVFTPPSDLRGNETKHGQTAAGEPCNDCVGRGFVLTPHGSPTLCLPCLGRGIKNRKA